MAEDSGVQVAEETKRPGPSDGQRRKFMTAISLGASNSSAAVAAGVPRKTFMRWIEQDPELQEEFEASFEGATDMLEDIAWNRAGDPTRRSDHLIQFLLAARRPWRYGQQRRLELTGPNGGPVQQRVVVGLAVQAGALEVLAERGLIQRPLPVEAA